MVLPCTTRVKCVDPTHRMECPRADWATNQAANDLGFEPCSLSSTEFKATYPDYWNRMVEEKVASVQIELGRNTMFIIMTTVCVAFTGSLLRLSLLKRSDIPEAWLSRFYPIIMLLACLPLINFYNFLMLASRVIRVIYHYCDDFITTECMITSTPAWEVRWSQPSPPCSLTHAPVTSPACVELSAEVTQALVLL